MPSALQQYLPFTVLKHFKCILLWIDITWVATVLTVYGIETQFLLRWVKASSSGCNSTYRLRYWNEIKGEIPSKEISPVATVLTVYGIETWITTILRAVHKPTLQQYLPFTVLKPKYALIEATLRSRCNSTYRLRYWNSKHNLHSIFLRWFQLQQYLPFTVLKPSHG